MFVYAKNTLQPSKLVFAYNLHCKINLYFRTAPSPKAKYCWRFLKSSGVLGSESGRLGLRLKKKNKTRTNIASKFLFSNFIQSECLSASPWCQTQHSSVGGCESYPHYWAEAQGCRSQRWCTLQWPFAWGRITDPVAWRIAYKPQVKSYTDVKISATMCIK